MEQKELNRRLVDCGYGYSMYPANWWTEKQVVKVERVMFHIKVIEGLKGKKLSNETIIEILKGLV